jgi:hypothetical protein
MKTEPTAEELQIQAFAFLRDQARNAHIAGDGLLVCVLCHTGIQRVGEFAKAKKLLLPFSEVAWMPILALYWMVNPDERHSVEQTLKVVERVTDEDRLIGQWLDRYRILIEQPLAGDAELSPVLKDFEWPGSFGEHTPEAEAVVIHMVELAWFHGPSGEHWKQLAETWQRTAPAWTHRMLTDLKTRLELQARLTAPDQPEALIPESDTEKLRAHSDIAELWLLHLHGRYAAVCEATVRLTPSLSAESHRWRVLHDFIHVNSAYGPREDSQSVSLARRRRLSVETPLLIFNDKRGQRLTETLGKLFRVRSEGEASMRWNIFILARLHELAALRVWDYGMWLEAIRAQSQANLEITQWTDAHPDMSAQGLLLAVRSNSANSPDNDKVVRRAIDTLEFAAGEVLTYFSNGLLATYPRQKHQALKLLKDITDLLPPEAWPALARWTISYVQESLENRLNGWTLAPAMHWLLVLPSLPADSPVWANLQPEVIGMANRSVCWRGEYKNFLQWWLLLAPLPLSMEVAEVMAVYPETSCDERLVRAYLLIKFEEWNPSLHGTCTRRLLSTAESSNEALILAKHLAEPDVTAREETLRECLWANVREAVNRATPPQDARKFSLSPGAKDVHLVSSWKIEDRPLLEELIAAVNSPNVLTEHLGWLLQTIQLLVANGPVEFAEVVQPYVTEWIRQLPHGRKMMGGESGPLSVMQWNSEGEGEIALMLGWLAFQLPRKLGVQSHAVFLAWARQMLFLGEIRPLDMAIYGSAFVALKTTAATSAEPLALMETAILSLSVHADHKPDAMLSLADALRNVCSLIDSELFEGAVSNSSPSSADTFVTVLSRFIPRFAISTHASLRAAVAGLVWQLDKHRRRESWISEVLNSLRLDNRARVRFEASGGWKEARSRANTRSATQGADQDSSD